MKRESMQKLCEWKDKPNKKPLIIRGARQVGKTWLMKRFGEQNFKNTVYINFDNNRQLIELFATDLEIARIIQGLEIYSGNKIDSKNTLLIFDEIQEAPKALASLKYFNETAPEYSVIAAGSLLGVAMHSGTSFPVGKVEFVDLYPLNFSEFLRAVGEEQYADLLASGDYTLINTFSSNYTKLLRQYYFIGGMPEAVSHFSIHNDFTAAREIQQQILDAYEQDFSKHAPNDIVPRIRMLWNSVPAQLAKENKKFVYGLVKEGARAKEYEQAMLWLTDCGLIHQVHRITVPTIPLKAYEDLKAFKLFLLDVGLLSCMVRLDPSVLLEGDVLFKEFKGALTEQYVLQQLKTIKDTVPYYWTNEKGSAEIDFIFSVGSSVIPLEVKAETNLMAKSLKVYHEKFSPIISIRASMSNYKKEDWLINLPLYMIEYIKREVELLQ